MTAIASTHAIPRGLRRVANHLKELRKSEGLSVRELADKAGIAFGYLDDIENGKADPTERTLELLAHALGTDLHHLVEKHEHELGD